MSGLNKEGNFANTIPERKVLFMKEKEQFKNEYDDGNIPEIDQMADMAEESAEPLPESTRPRKDGPGGE